MFIVGLTGGIGTGKSTVSEIFRKYSIPVIDADIIARKVVEPERKAWKKLKKAFGNIIFNKDGTINREELSKIIFDDPSKRRILNEITHPEIVKEIFFNTLHYLIQGHQFVLMDLPLLYETEFMLDYIYKVIVVTCEPELQLTRLKERSGMTEDHAKQRIASQMPLDRKCELADYVIENSGNIEELEKQTKLPKY